MESAMTEVIEDKHLTQRETEVLKLMCDGLSNQDIADRLEMSSRTVGSHRYNLTRKTGCTNSVQMGVWAVKQGIVA